MSARRSGFTLVEVVLVATLLALVFGLVATIIATILNGAGNVSEALTYDNEAGEIEELIASDLAFLAPVPNVTPVRFEPEGAGFATLVFYSAAGARTANGEPVTPVHRVTYSVHPLAGGGKGLFRGEEPLVESRDAYYDAPVLVAEGVTLFKVEASDGGEWRERWPGDGAGPLPALIRVFIDVPRPDGESRRLVIESAPMVEAVQKPTDRSASGGEDKPQASPTEEPKPFEAPDENATPAEEEAAE